MDLLTQLKTLRGTTKSPEVRSICESNIQKIEKQESVHNYSEDSSDQENYGDQ